MNENKITRGIALVGILMALIALVVGIMGLGLPAPAAIEPAPATVRPIPLATGYACAVHTEQGCAKFVIESGGELEILSGAVLDVQTGATVGIPATTFDGNQTINGNLVVTGTAGIGGASILTGSLTVNDNASITGTLGVDGASTLGGALTVNDNASITGTLGVDGASTLGGALTVNNNMTLTGTQTLAAGAKLDTAEGTGEGIVLAAYIDTTYSVTTTGQITIPANADVVDWSFVVITAYDDSGTDYMECGSVADADRYVDDLDLSATGRNLALDANDMQLDESSNWGDVGASALALQCIYTGQNGNASAGAGKFVIWYRLD